MGSEEEELRESRPVSRRARKSGGTHSQVGIRLCDLGNRCRLEDLEPREGQHRKPAEVVREEEAGSTGERKQQRVRAASRLLLIYGPGRTISRISEFEEGLGPRASSSTLPFSPPCPSAPPSNRAGGAPPHQHLHIFNLSSPNIPDACSRPSTNFDASAFLVKPITIRRQADIVALPGSGLFGLLDFAIVKDEATARD